MSVRMVLDILGRHDDLPRTLGIATIVPWLTSPLDVRGKSWCTHSRALEDPRTKHLPFVCCTNYLTATRGDDLSAQFSMYRPGGSDVGLRCCLPDGELQSDRWYICLTRMFEVGDRKGTTESSSPMVSSVNTNSRHAFLSTHRASTRHCEIN